MSAPLEGITVVEIAVGVSDLGLGLAGGHHHLQLRVRGGQAQQLGPREPRCPDDAHAVCHAADCIRGPA